MVAKIMKYQCEKEIGLSKSGKIMYCREPAENVCKAIDEAYGEAYISYRCGGHIETSPSYEEAHEDDLEAMADIGIERSRE